jgi:translation initiation factor IF-1
MARRRRPFTYKEKTDPSKESVITLDAKIVENLPNPQFNVMLLETESEILCTISGKMRRHWIRLMEGDRVKVEITPYDPERGRIVFRYND